MSRNGEMVMPTPQMNIKDYLVDIAGVTRELDGAVDAIARHCSIGNCSEANATDPKAIRDILDSELTQLRCILEKAQAVQYRLDEEWQELTLI